RSKQPFARLAIETLNPLAQPLDRLDEIVALRGQRRVLGLDFAQLLLGAQVDGAEPLAVALELFKLRLDRGNVRQGRIRLETSKRGQRFRLNLQNFADLGGEVHKAAPDRLVALLGTRRGFARR